MRLALIIAGIGALGLLGCQSGGNASAKPKAVDRYVQGMRAYSGGDKDQAISTLVEATRANPDLIMARLILGDLYKDKGDYKDAVDQYEHVVKLAVRVVVFPVEPVLSQTIEVSSDPGVGSASVDVYVPGSRPGTTICPLSPIAPAAVPLNVKLPAAPSGMVCFSTMRVPGGTTAPG